MNKGFVFTIDSVFAIIATAALISSIGLMQQTETGKEKSFIFAAETSRDKAMVETYIPTMADDTAPSAEDNFYSTNTLQYFLPKETVMPRPPTDIALAIDLSESMAEQDIFLYSTPSTMVSGGKCNSGGSCLTVTDCDNYDTTTAKKIGEITIDNLNQLFTIRKELSSFGTYSGNCVRPKVFLKSPIGTIFDLTSKKNCPTPTSITPNADGTTTIITTSISTCNYCTTPSNVSGITPNITVKIFNTGECCYGETATGECTDNTVEQFPKLLSGTWEIFGWSDSPTQFNSTKYYIPRINAVKKAVKTFLDNPGWKATDTFGVIGFSSSAGGHFTDLSLPDCCTKYPVPYPGCAIATCAALNNDRNPLKIEIEKMATVHGTDTSSGINAAIQILNLGINKKYLVLLTDGKTTNIPAFLTEAANARTAGITVYTIGFSGKTNIQQEITDTDGLPNTDPTFEDKLIEAAKDKDSTYCIDPTDPLELCGKYYFAATGTELNAVYQQIAAEMSNGEIGAQSEIVQIKKNGG